MKYLFFIQSLILAFSHLQAQTGQISGKVIDSKTKEPLPFTNVYINSTTIGTTTDSRGEFNLKNLPIGSAEIVFSFVGYTSTQLSVEVKTSLNIPLNISLTTDAQQLSEIDVKSTRDKAWEKQEKKFENIFLGAKGNSKILNPWVIEIFAENKYMKAKAVLPIEIENQTLGYKLFFQLKNFSYSAVDYSIVGNVRFTEISTSNAEDVMHWMKNREMAYLGSAKHLMKSILDHKINGEGFLLFTEKIRGQMRNAYFSMQLAQNLLPMDTTLMIAAGRNQNEYQIKIKNKLEVHYTLDYSDSRYYSDTNVPVSWIEVNGGIVRIDQDGTILNPTDVVISGDMSNGRVSRMLPTDYKPGKIIRVEQPKKISASRLKENVYLHTDKSYYYPGDKLWFAAYMHYNAPRVIDTLSKVLYVDLISPDKSISKNLILKIDSGKASGCLNLPNKLMPGKYILRAYTQWMRNYGIDQFFYKSINILNISDGVDEVASSPVTEALLNITFDKSAFQKKEKVKMSLKLDTGSLGDLLKGDFSITVVDENLAVPLKESTSIKNYFESNEHVNQMLSVFKYPIERGVTLEGRYRTKNGKSKKTKLTILPDAFTSIYQLTTLDNGEFILKDQDFYDSAKFGFQPTEGTIILNHRETPVLPDSLPDTHLSVVPSYKSYGPFSSDTTQSVMLKEIRFTEKKLREYDNSYSHPDYNIKSKDIEFYQNLGVAIAAKIPGFKLILYEGTWFLIRQRGEFTKAAGTPAEPALFIDGALVVGQTTGDRLVTLNPFTIDHVEAKGMIGSNLGANGANGFIAVFMLKKPESNFKGLSVVKARGFNRSENFVSPNYDLLPPNSGNDDFRSTLYWNPHVTLKSSMPPTELFFYTSDHAGNFRVIVEGVTNQGSVIHSEAVFKVID